MYEWPPVPITYRYRSSAMASAHRRAAVRMASFWVSTIFWSMAVMAA
jgi:hypothetical protein